MRNDRERLCDILEAIEQIEKYAVQGRNAFDADELLQTWVLRHLEILGEAARAVSAEFQGQHPELPWAKMIGMRNILVHHYFGIDHDIVWGVVTSDLPDLKSKVQAILGE